MQLAASNEKRAPVTVHYHHYNELPPIKPVAVPPLQVYDLCHVCHVSDYSIDVAVKSCSAIVRTIVYKTQTCRDIGCRSIKTDHLFAAAAIQLI